MSENTTKPSTVDDEVDISEVLKAIKNFLRNIVKGIINVFYFFYKHKLVLLGLIVLGVVLGYFYEQNTQKTYKNDILVIPNFGSADYLYSKVEALDNKLAIDDSLFIKSIFGKAHKKVSSIEIEPVIDIYSFVSQREANQELFQLLFEEEANVDFVENPINSRNFKYHRIHLWVKGESNHEEISEALITYLNTNEYFNSLKSNTLNNLDLQLSENKKIIQQIDEILLSEKSDKSVVLDQNSLSFSDNRGLGELLKQKDGLVKQQEVIIQSKINFTNVIGFVDSNYKIFDNEELLKKSKVKLFPVLFIAIYCLFFLFKYISNNVKNITS
jgi:hypothetical protein